MAGKNTAAFGIFASRAAAETAVDRLSAAGFSHDDVSVLMSDQASSNEFAAEKNTKAPEGTATGVTVGGITGGTLGLLAGLGALAIPGVGPLIAAGPIMGALAGLGVGGTVGGLIGALIGLGIPEYEAKRYEGRVKEGGILVSAHCDSSDEVSRAKDLLRDSGGEDVSSSGERTLSTHMDRTDAALDRNASRESYDHPGSRDTAIDAQTYAGSNVYEGRTGTAVDDATDRKPIISTPK